MELLLSYFLAPIGLGCTASCLFNSSTSQRLRIGESTFLGFVLIPLLLFALNVILRIPLDICALVIMMIAIPGLIRMAYLAKGNARKLLIHPVFIIVLPIFLIFLVTNNGYYPSAWDEFSHWATMPKQIFLHNEVTSNDFLIQNFISYTPGWPLAIIFKDLVFSNSLNYDHFLLLGLLSSLYLLCLLFDISSSVLSRHSAMSWILVLLAPLFYVPANYFLKVNLIETPMTHAVCAFFILLFSTTSMNENRKEQFFKAGIVLAYCYIIKHTFMTLFPIALLFLLWTIFKTQEDKRFLQKFFNKKAIYSIFLLVGPYILVFIAWQINLSLHGHSQGYSPVNHNTFSTAIEKVIERAHLIIPLSLARLLDTFLIGTKREVFILLISPLFLLGAAQFRRTAVALFAYLGFYFICLIWMYLTVFSMSDAQVLASFERFMEIPLAPIKLFSYIAITIFIFKKIPQRISNSLNKYQAYVISLLAIVIFIGFHRNFSRNTLNKNNVSIEAEKLIQTINQHSLEKPKVLIVAQGGDRLEYHIANFESMGGDRYLFSVMPGTSWGETEDNIWRTKVTKEEMIQKISQIGLLWVIKSDAWFDEILSSLEYDNRCSGPYENYFIINKGNNTYHCSEK